VALWLHGKAIKTQREYRADADRFLSFVGKPLAGVTLGDLQDYAADLETRGLAAATRARRLAAVKSLLTFGARLEMLRVNVGAALPLPKRKDTLAERIIGEEDIGRLLAGATTDRDRALLRVLYTGGLRVSEATGLRWRDLKARKGGGQATVFGKGSKTRTVLLPPPTWAALMALRGAAKGDDPVFRSREGNALSPVQAWRVVKAAAARAGLDPLPSCHWLRHSGASHSLDHGAPISLVQRVLGHASMATTGRYLHARPDQGFGDFLPNV
jgi:integrase/recombinase XerD